MSPIETPSEAAGHGARQLRGAAAGALVNLSGGDGLMIETPIKLE
jgi:hypothetical protein